MSLCWPHILLALLCFLTLATSASAECAWVLWESDSSNPKAPEWVKAAYQTYAACKKEADAINTQWQHALSTGKLTPDLVRCLPDTIDPRGPKGR